LRDILILVEGVLGELSLFLFDREFDQEEHDGLERRDGNISGALAGDVLVEQGQSRRGLADPDELVSALEHILGFLVRWRRLLNEARVSISIGRGTTMERELTRA
jgi:hypothetical protein